MAWTVAAAGAAALGTVLGVFGSVGVLIGPLAHEFAAPRAHLVPLFAVSLLVHATVAPAAGRLADRVGPRPLLLAAAGSAAAGLLAVAAAATVPVAVAGYGLGIGTASAATWVATTTAVAGWFTRRRTAALGLLTAGPALGGAVLAPTVAALADARPRAACVVLAGVVAVVCLVSAAVVPGRSPEPSRSVAPAVGAAGTAVAPGRLIGAAALMSLVVFLPLVHLAGEAADLGLSAAQAAGLLAATSVASAASRLAIGWWAEGPRLLTAFRACHLLVAAGFGVWAAAGPGRALPVLLVSAVLFGVGYGGWLALGPAVLAATCPPATLGGALGRLAAATGAGGVAGPLAAGPLLEATATPVVPVLAAVVALAATTALPRP